MNDVPPDHPIAAWLEATRSEPDPPGAVRVDGERRPRLRRLLIATAAASSAAVILGVVAAGRAVPVPGPEPAGAAAAASDAAIATATVPTSAPVPPAGPPVPLPGTAPASAALPEPVAWDPAAAAAAVIAVRADAGEREYVDAAAADAITREGGITLVSVRALVLRRSGGVWSGPVPVRFAVPLDPDTLAPAGRAWRLPDPTSSAAAVTWQPERDPALLRAATAALATAGYRRAQGVRLRRAATYPEAITASVSALAPGQRSIRRHELWLTADAQRVLGVPARIHRPAVEEEQ